MEIKEIYDGQKYQENTEKRNMVITITITMIMITTITMTITT